ncbi:hypothetical protein AB0I81_09280 [Nonomuraea sp. NPDC050404]|uniref:hypothetical protein n=1 Tax=Nonomuraea sp. NPDC050404 TaxID=3155783 RepID=UPI0033EC8895
MNIVANTYFGIITRDDTRYRARVEVPDRPDVVVVTQSDMDLMHDEVARKLAELLDTTPEHIDVHLFGHDGKGEAPTYAGAAVFDGDQWHTQFPAQEDLPTALTIPPSPSYESAADRVRAALARALGRPEDALDIEFFEITPNQYAAEGDQGKP